MLCYALLVCKKTHSLVFYLTFKERIPSFSHKDFALSLYHDKLLVCLLNFERTKRDAYKEMNVIAA